ncbi:MAG: ATP-binding protein, partial [Rhodothermales bacterium]
MSHEIRTPLTAILGFADLLTRRVPGKFQKYAQRIEGAGGRLMETLNLVLELARLDASETQTNGELLTVAEETREIVELFRPRAEAKNLHLTFSATTDVRDAKMMLDRGALSSVLNNLVGNAIKFTDKGRVAVSVCLAGEPAPERIEIQVTDTGIGINPSFLPQLFDEFAQESEGQERSHEGSGLGLAIAKRLADVMGGTIAAESEKGRGSTFTLSFPLREPAGEEEAGVVPNAPPDQAEVRRGLAHVLLVEDNEDTQFLLQSLLEDTCKVTAASTAEEALEATTQPPGGRPFDLILLDINLGSNKSGTDVLHELRALPGYEATPIVALTAYALPGDKERFEAMGFTTYLPKPFQFDELLATIEQLVG